MDENLAIEINKTLDKLMNGLISISHEVKVIKENVRYIKRKQNSNNNLPRKIQKQEDDPSWMLIDNQYHYVNYIE